MYKMARQNYFAKVMVEFTFRYFKRYVQSFFQNPVSSCKTQTNEHFKLVNCKY